jgi:hypothetical protein
MKNTVERSAPQARRRDSSVPGAARRRQPKQATRRGGRQGNGQDPGAVAPAEAPSTPPPRPPGLIDILPLLPLELDPEHAIAAWLRRGIAIAHWQPVAGETAPQLDPLPAAKDPKGVLAVWRQIGGHLPPGSTPESAAQLLLDRLTRQRIPCTDAYARSLSVPGEVRADAVLAALMEFLPPEKAERLLRRAIRKGVFRLSAAGTPERIQLRRNDARIGEWQRANNDFIVCLSEVSELRERQFGSLVYRDLCLHAEDATQFVTRARKHAVRKAAAHSALPAPTAPSTISISDIVLHLQAQRRETWSIAKWLERDDDADRLHTMAELGTDDLPLGKWSEAYRQAFDDKLLERVMRARRIRDQLLQQVRALRPGEKYPGEREDLARTRFATEMHDLSRGEFRPVRRATLPKHLLRRGARLLRCSDA